LNDAQLVSCIPIADLMDAIATVLARVNDDVVVDLPPAAPRRTPRASDGILSGLVVGQIAFLTYAKLRSRFTRIRG
jgi:hypothetical protein